MKILRDIKFLTASLALLFVGIANSSEKQWHFEAGAGIRNQTPLVLVGGVSYDRWMVRIQGLGFKNGPKDFWCGIQSSFLMSIFKESPFNVSVGIGAGYEYAQAPNEMHSALNQANKATYLYPYNNKEILDVSGEIWANIYGFYTQISIPVYKFMNHSAPNLLWGIGYLYQF